MLVWEFDAEGSDSIDNDDLELVADVTHESTDLLHQPIDGSFVAGLCASVSRQDTLPLPGEQTLSKVVIA